MSEIPDLVRGILSVAAQEPTTDLLSEMEAESRSITVTQDQASLIARLADEFRKRKHKLERAEKLVKARQVAFDEIRLKLLPQALKEARVAEMKTIAGAKVSSYEEIQASISEANREAAHAWLREKEFGSIIKNVITVSLDRKQDGKAAEIIEMLQKAGVAPERKESVHSSTLKAFVKERFKAGDELPKAFTIYRHQVADVE